MNRIISRAAATVAAAGITLAALAGTASASVSEFLTDLGYLGYPQSRGTQQSAIELGESLCDYLGSGASAGDAMDSLRHGPMHVSIDEAAAWVVAATNDLCPQYK